MPTGGGLPKAGDVLIKDGTMYRVTERTSTSAPFSVWIKRQDGKSFTTGNAPGSKRSDNFRYRGAEYRIMCETGKLPDGWEFWDPAGWARTMAAQQLPEDGQHRVTMPDQGPTKAAKPRPRRIQFAPARRAYPEQGEEVDMTFHYDAGRAQVVTMSKIDILEMIVKGSEFLRNDAEGLH